jgi:RND family efflux transporter MFP subunit
LVAALAGCSNDPQADTTSTPWVKTVAIEAASGSRLQLSGTVRAQHENPVAFQLGGRILSRHVEAGQAVQQGQLLLTLDPRDVAASEQAAQAQVGVAQATTATAKRELERQQQLVAQGFVSPQSLERLELQLRNALSQLDAAQAAATQARNAKGYTELRAAQAGVIMEITAEAGQVVSSGQSLGTLAHAGVREIEVFLPSPQAAAEQGHVRTATGQVDVRLREVAGAADPTSRTWRARYVLAPNNGADATLPLGSVVQVTLQASNGQGVATQHIPLTALDERGETPSVWQVVNGVAQPVTVEVLQLDTTKATIRSSLPNGQRVIALGTHLLTPGMAVQELAP